MSRSAPTNTLVNPATKFLSWNSENGYFEYWDKVAKANITIKLPVKFYVLDELTTIKGFSDKHQGGIWSNEVKNITNQNFKVVGKGKDGKFFQVSEGLYPKIKDAIVAAGGKYTRSLYAAMLNENEEYEIVNFQLKGAAFSGWLEFTQEKGKSVMADEIICETFKKEKKGATKYTVPIFTSESASEEGNDAAIALDVELQSYLRDYFTKTQAEVEYVTETEQLAEDKEQLPF